MGDDDRVGRLAAVYNVFAFVMLVILLMVLPRYTESLHPGKDGNPGFQQLRPRQQFQGRLLSSRDRMGGFVLLDVHLAPADEPLRPSPVVALTLRTHECTPPFEQP